MEKMRKIAWIGAVVISLALAGMAQSSHRHDNKVANSKHAGDP